MQEMFEAIVTGAGNEGVEVVIRPALTAADMLAAGGYLLGTPANIGYMSGPYGADLRLLLRPLS